MNREVYIMPQIIPIKDLKNTSEISDMCHKAAEPIYVTKNGYGDMVIMSMETYESTMRQIAMYRDIEISEKQIKAGQVKDARTALREMKAKYGI
jgi:PHD/YefM family antitoxin component YafN of YafNO toxin-antitoxin module